MMHQVTQGVHLLLQLTDPSSLPLTRKLLQQYSRLLHMCEVVDCRMVRNVLMPSEEVRFAIGVSMTAGFDQNTSAR